MTIQVPPAWAGAGGRNSASGTSCLGLTGSIPEPQTPRLVQSDTGEPAGTACDALLRTGCPRSSPHPTKQAMGAALGGLRIDCGIVAYSKSCEKILSERTRNVAILLAPGGCPGACSKKRTSPVAVKLPPPLSVIPANPECRLRGAPTVSV